MSKPRRRQNGKPLHRAGGTRRELRTVVVFCEGKNSEPEYVNGLKRLPHVLRDTALNIEIHPDQGGPLTLVKMAVERKKDPEVDECWCLFDVEWPQHHPRLTEALDLAKRADVRLAISNPCFELWLILHHRAHTHFVETGKAESESRKLDSRKGKSVDVNVYMPLRGVAAHRAEALERRHIEDGTPIPRRQSVVGDVPFSADDRRSGRGSPERVMSGSAHGGTCRVGCSSSTVGPALSPLRRPASTSRAPRGRRAARGHGSSVTGGGLGVIGAEGSVELRLFRTKAGF